MILVPLKQTPTSETGHGNTVGETFNRFCVYLLIQCFYCGAGHTRLAMWKRDEVAERPKWSRIIIATKEVGRRRWRSQRKGASDQQKKKRVEVRCQSGPAGGACKLMCSGHNNHYDWAVKSGPPLLVPALVQAAHRFLEPRWPGLTTWNTTRRIIDIFIAPLPLLIVFMLILCIHSIFLFLHLFCF